VDPDAHSAALPLVDARDALSGFASGQVADDVTRFQAAADAVKQGEVIAKLEAQISDVQSQIDGVNNAVAEGATSQIGDAITFGFQIAESAMSVETDAGAAVLGVGFAIKDEVEKGIAFAEEMKRKNEELDKLIGQYRGLVEGLAADQQQMAILLTVGGHAKGFAAGVGTSVDVVNMLLAKLQQLARGIDSLSLVDEPPTAGFYSSQLDIATNAWAAVADSCGQQLQLARSLT
jgi:hypothetical protein